jgi:hypothetical protein
MNTNTTGVLKDKNGEAFIIRHPTILVETDLYRPRIRWE